MLTEEDDEDPELLPPLSPSPEEVIVLFTEVSAGSATAYAGVPSSGRYCICTRSAGSGPGKISVLGPSQSTFPSAS
jgi:hypothetical protein